MFNKGFNAEEMLEAGKSAIKKQVKATTQSAQAQIQSPPSQPTAAVGTNEAISQQASNLQDDANKDFIKDLYNSSGNSQNTTNSALSSPQDPAMQTQNPEDAVKLAKARSHLQQHMETYYKPTFERPPSQEESTAEKLEREDQEKEAKKMEELRGEQKKNEVPMAIRMGQNKAEKFPGASG